jgi:hypothetical protein
MSSVTSPSEAALAREAAEFSAGKKPPATNMDKINIKDFII